jgi:hypothetical protein
MREGQMMNWGRFTITIATGAAAALSALVLLIIPAQATAAGAAPVVLAQGPLGAKPALKDATPSPAKKYGGWDADRNWQARKPHVTGPCYPFGCDYRGPSYPFGPHYNRAPVYAGPVYVTPTYPRRWIAGYWTQQWVPQYSAYQVWVPGYYAGTWWVPGHYEQQSAETGGYYQQVWVDGYWEE